MFEPISTSRWTTMIVIESQTFLFPVFQFFSCIGALNSKYCSKKMCTYVVGLNKLNFFQALSNLVHLSQFDFLDVITVKLKPMNFNMIAQCTRNATYL